MKKHKKIPVYDFISDKKLEKIKQIIDSCQGDVETAYDRIESLLDKNFKVKGLGTNRIVFTHRDKKFKDLIFKVAGDTHGIEANYREFYNGDLDKSLTYSYSISKDGTFIVQEKVKAFPSYDFMKEHKKEVRRMLKSLENKILLVDCKLSNFKNFGIRKNGEVCLLDHGDTVPLPDYQDSNIVNMDEETNVSLRCKKFKDATASEEKLKPCNGKLKYSKNYDYLECTKCKAIMTVHSAYKEFFGDRNAERSGKEARNELLRNLDFDPYEWSEKIKNYCEETMKETEEKNNKNTDRERDYNMTTKIINNEECKQLKGYWIPSKYLKSDSYGLMIIAVKSNKMKPAEFLKNVKLNPDEYKVKIEDHTPNEDKKNWTENVQSVVNTIVEIIDEDDSGATKIEIPYDALANKMNKTFVVDNIQKEKAIYLQLIKLPYVEKAIYTKDRFVIFLSDNSVSLENNSDTDDEDINELLGIDNNAPVNDEEFEEAEYDDIIDTNEESDDDDEEEDSDNDDEYDVEEDEIEDAMEDEENNEDFVIIRSLKNPNKGYKIWKSIFNSIQRDMLTEDIAMALAAGCVDIMTEDEDSKTISESIDIIDIEQHEDPQMASDTEESEEDTEFVAGDDETPSSEYVDDVMNEDAIEDDEDESVSDDLGDFLSESSKLFIYNEICELMDNGELSYNRKMSQYELRITFDDVIGIFESVIDMCDDENEKSKLIEMCTAPDYQKISEFIHDEIGINYVDLDFIENKFILTDTDCDFSSTAMNTDIFDCALMCNNGKVVYTLYENKSDVQEKFPDLDILVYDELINFLKEKNIPYIVEDNHIVLKPQNEESETDEENDDEELENLVEDEKENDNLETTVLTELTKSLNALTESINKLDKKLDTINENYENISKRVDVAFSKFEELEKTTKTDNEKTSEDIKPETYSTELIDGKKFLPLDMNSLGDTDLLIMLENHAMLLISIKDIIDNGNIILDPNKLHTVVNFDIE